MIAAPTTKDVPMNNQLNEPPQGIPMPLWLDLERFKPILERKRSVIQYRTDRRSYRLRFRFFHPSRGYHVKRSIGLGKDPELINHVQNVLERWQNLYRWQKIPRARNVKKPRNDAMSKRSSGSISA
jgi:hypothetical protein